MADLKLNVDLPEEVAVPFHNWLPDFSAQPQSADLLPEPAAAARPPVPINEFAPVAVEIAEAVEPVFDLQILVAIAKRSQPICC